MKTEIQVLERLKDMIVTYLNENVSICGSMRPENISQDNIEIDFPDTDNMRKNSMFYIQPDNEEIENLSMSSDLATMNVSICILCKGASSTTLIKKVFGYYSALYTMLRQNQTLDGYIESVNVVSMDYYPAVTASRNMTAIETQLQMQWAKEF